MSVHTPGPWRVEMPGRSTPHIWVSAKLDGSIAKIECCDYDDGLGPRLTDDDQANARLIAAAPDLLSALLALAERMERTGRDTANVLDLALTKKARAAIAKATGQ